MFTGIVQSIGSIVQVAPSASAWQGEGQEPSTPGVRITVSAPNLGVDDIGLGDSIAINGACMTVVDRKGSDLYFDVSRESLSRTTGLDRTGSVNLEKSMRASDRFGGHFVTGHIDGLGKVKDISPAGESHRLSISLPESFSAFVCEKGSICIHGVSLTVNRVTDGSAFTVIDLNIIPHTWSATTLHHLQAGDSVNVELDQMAKHVARILARMNPRLS